MTNIGSSMPDKVNSSTSGDSAQLGVLRMLVVEDDEHMLRIIKFILKQLGVGEIGSAAGVAEALAYMRNTPPDIVIVDWMLQPPLNGIDLVRSVRNATGGVNPYTPVCMLTGHSDLQRVLEARDAGVTEFLVKPVSVRTVAMCIAEIINNPRPFVRSKDYLGPDRRRKVLPYSGPERRRAAGAPPMASPAEAKAALSNSSEREARK
jgi:two-component system, chemotaxis family, chemotaxis protein CheY